MAHPSRPASLGSASLGELFAGKISGEVRFDAVTRAIYSTDASHYRIEPLGVVFPCNAADVEAIVEVARAEGAPLIPRGGGTSQCGQAIGRAVVVDTSRWLTGIGPLLPDRGAAACATVDVEPGVVLDELNAHLKPEGLWFPVDPSTGSRATIGGMAGNNSAGSRSLRYGPMVRNVEAVEAVLAGGERLSFEEGRIGRGDFAGLGASRPEPGRRGARLRRRLLELYGANEVEIGDRIPPTLRNVAGYRVEELAPGREHFGKLLVGSEGTLAFFTRLRLRLATVPARRTLGVCHFSTLYAALGSVEAIVALGPSAVELVDHRVLELAGRIPDMKDAITRSYGCRAEGLPGAVLLVEFSGAPTDRLGRSLDGLEEVLAGRGSVSAVHRVESPAAQADVWRVRKAGMSVVMSMSGPRKPISFIEDCAVPLARLEEYARRVNAIFERHGLSGTWYAHASVGCLHVRPALDLADPDDVRRLRAVAEETHEVVRDCEGTHSGEHGDGITRSEFLEPMLGSRMVRLFAEIKRTLDPEGRMNPGKIVDPHRMDDASLFRLPPAAESGAAAGSRGSGSRDSARWRGSAGEKPLPTVLAWEGGLARAASRCDGNAACRRLEGGVMCPSYRVTRDEQHSTRGRAGALRAALSLDAAEAAAALDSSEMDRALSLCISCKACARECPAGIDMAAMKLEWMHRRNRRYGVPRRERTLAELPRWAPLLGRGAGVLNALGRSAALRKAADRWLGISARRPLPEWSRAPWSEQELLADPNDRKAPVAKSEETFRVALFVDTHTRWFEPEIARSAASVLRFLGLEPVPLGPTGYGGAGRTSTPLCCGRTYLSAGMVDEARTEARRLVDAALPPARKGVPVVGLEPSCVSALTDEIPKLLGTPEARELASNVSLFEEAVVDLPQARRKADSGSRPDAGSGREILVHAHCHQKAAGLELVTQRALRLHLPGAKVSTVAAGCCGMAGSFGYRSEYHDTSLAMAELELLPALRESPEAVVVAPGTSCRAQIRDGLEREAMHAAVLLARRLDVRGRRR